MIESTDCGLYCPAGDFYIDPWKPVQRAVLTHGHSDHARRGAGRFLAADDGVAILRSRLGQDAEIESISYGQKIMQRDVQITFYPAGHILGSAQVRLECRGEIWVISGDYKLDKDPTCASFEPVSCHTFVTESTFGLPIYRWPACDEVLSEINRWWLENQQAGRTTVLFAYALGKAQRILASLDDSLGPILTHGAVEQLNHCYRRHGVTLPPTTLANEAPAGTDWSRALILAPPSAAGSPWMRRFKQYSTGFASGWMIVRGRRRRRALDRGFVLSDHADWPGLMSAVRETGAERIYVTHGYVSPVVRWLREQGYRAEAMATRYVGDEEDGEAGERATSAPEGGSA